MGFAGATIHDRPEFTQCARAFEAEVDYLYRTLIRHGVARSDVEDAVQDVFLVMWRRWTEYDQSRPLRPWLAGIASNLAQHRRYHREIPTADVLSEDTAPDPEQYLGATRARAVVLAALGSLPEKHRAPIVMHDLDGLSVSEIAGLCGVSVATAWARVRSARREFAKTVRRQQKLGMLGRASSVSMAAALLRIERQPPPAPREARRRAMARAWAVLLHPPGPPAPQPRPRTVPAPLIGAAAGLVAAGGLLVAAHWQPPPSSRTNTPVAGARAAARLPLQAPLPLPTWAPAAPDDVSDDVPQAGLVGHWRNDGAGLGARDLSAGDECTIRSPHPTEALDFDGHTWLECPHVDRLATVENEISVAAWIRPRSTLRSRTIAARQDGEGRSDDLLFGIQNSTLLVVSNTWSNRLSYPLPKAARRWMHVAFTRNGHGTLRLYLDGAMVAEKTRRPFPVGGGHHALTIGAAINGPDPTAADEGFIGEMDDVVVYDRALPPAAIDALATSRH